MKKFYIYIVGMVLQLHKFTKNHWVVRLKWVIFMACNLYHNKVVSENQLDISQTSSSLLNSPPPQAGVRSNPKAKQISTANPKETR